MRYVRRGAELTTLVPLPLPLSASPSYLCQAWHRAVQLSGARLSVLVPASLPASNSTIASCARQAIDRRERLRRLALETIDLTKDPYFMRNHLGQYECRLCLTLHNNEGNYLAHTQVRRSAVPNARAGWGTRAMLIVWYMLLSRTCHRVLVALLQGKRHQQNLAKRAAREAAEKAAAPAPQRRAAIKKTGEGHPGLCASGQSLQKPL